MIAARMRRGKQEGPTEQREDCCQKHGTQQRSQAISVIMICCDVNRVLCRHRLPIHKEKCYRYGESASPEDSAYSVAGKTPAGELSHHGRLLDGRAGLPQQQDSSNIYRPWFLRIWSKDHPTRQLRWQAKLIVGGACQATTLATRLSIFCTPVDATRTRS